MADYAPNATCRYKAHYKAAGIFHSMQVRYARGTTGAVILTNGRLACTSIALPFAALLPADFEFISEEYALEDSDVFIPGPLKPTFTAGSVALADLSAVERITSTGFSGKGGSSKCSVYLYCPDFPEDTLAAVGSRGVITGGESAEVQDVADFLNTLAVPLVAINNVPAVWRARATIKRNDFLLARVRRGLLA